MKVEHDERGNRFFVHFADEDAELAYSRIGPRLIDLQHTYVPESARGQGVAEALAEAAFAYAREQDLRVVPSCPFVRSWLRHHVEQRDLLDPAYAKLLQDRPRS
jgi:predicted GNAT family acetyltransferase